MDSFHPYCVTNIGKLPLLKEKEVQHHIQQCKRHEFTFCFGTMKWPFFKKKMRIFYPWSPERDQMDWILVGHLEASGFTFITHD